MKDDFKDDEYDVIEHVKNVEFAMLIAIGLLVLIAVKLFFTGD